MPWGNNQFPLLIVTSSGGFTGLFVYSPGPGANNLIASTAAAAGTDPYGNHFLAGETTYNNAGGFAVNQNGNAISFYGGSLAAGWTQQSHMVSQSNGTLQTLTGSTGADAPVTELLLSQNDAIAQFGGAGPGGLFLTGNANEIVADQMFTYVPGSGRGSIENWHLMSAIGFVNGWTAGARVAPQYRLIGSPPNEVEVIGSLVVPAGVVAGQVIVTLPAGYRPANTQSAPGFDITTHNAIQFTLGAAGNFSFGGAVGATAVGNTIDFHGFYSLDA